MTTPAAQLAPAAVAESDWPWLRSAMEMAALLSGYWPVEPDAGARQMAPGGLGAGGTAGAGAVDTAGWTSAPRAATRAPAPHAQSVAAARAFTLRTLRRWGAGDCAEDAAAVMSELLTNALQHAASPTAITAGSPIRIGLLHPGPCVLCAVADSSNQLPVPREPDWLAETGRGLQVVASLSHRWGYCPGPDQRGKVVWATVLTRPAKT